MKEIEKIIKQEGDYHHFIHNCDGIEIDCEIIRNGLGALCGYVCINSDNSLYRLDYDEISFLIDYTPHGGLTWSEDNGSGSWQIGFDCIHAGDFCPNLPSNYGGGIYRDLEFVKSECKKLAESVSKHSKLIKRLKNIDSILGK
jgi:hypothetical protein